jgi:ribose-phosphate pyrophosphokinase
MIIVYTHAARHLAPSIALPHTEYNSTKFSDGELYLKLESPVNDQDVLIICSTQAPAENLLELFFLLKALSDSQPKSIILLFSYFGYARQSVALSGEAATTAFICQTLQQFNVTNTTIIHAHAPDTLYRLLPFTNAIAIDFFCNAAQEYDIIAAPDKGAAHFAQQVGDRCNKQVVFLHKRRPVPERVTIESVDGNVCNKKVLLVDDILATGNTLIEASNRLRQLGATHIAAAVTHGIFSQNAHERLMHSGIEKVYVTNTLPQTPSSITHVYDIGPFIKELVVTLF